ncbi:MAG TPA: PDZ domain-containing protein [Gemmataceae bacterium]|jgi:hypothetical protein
MTAKFALLSVTLLGAALCSATAVVGGEDKPPPPTDQGRKEIEKLIDQLGSDDFKVREEATRRLMERDDAVPALERAAKSDAAEVASRARKAIEAINKRMAKRGLRRAVGLLKKGQTDQFVEQVVTWREYMDEDCWKADVEHVEAIADAASEVSGGQFALTRKLPEGLHTLPWLDVTKLTFRHGDHYAVPKDEWISDKRIVAESIYIPKGLLRDSFLISRGPVETTYSQSYSVIFANENVKAGDKETGAIITNSLVVCDGDVSVTSSVENSVIFATGNVRVGWGIVNSVIICGGDVKWALKNPRCSAKKSVIREHKRNPLDFLNRVHFFDPTQVGIKVKTAGKGVRIEALAASKSFAQAGVRTGDYIVAVDGAKVTSTNAFRRLLRQRILESKPILLDIRRAEKPMRIQVDNVSESS